ncbi:MAG: TRAP transporter large permease [Pseudomonadota bacterium]|nr:TRAP transporter large permease [Pseudomonadota bacterium]
MLILMVVLIGLAILGAPLGVAMIASGIAYLLFNGQDVGLVTEQVMNNMFNSYVVIAVPLFIFAANIMNAGTISDRLFALGNAFVGHLRGGLAYVNVLVSVIFAGMSGSAIADAAGPGMVSIRMMTEKKRYTPEFSAALTASAASIGPIVPPSIPMILYALVSGTSVGALFLAGVVPGLLMALALSLVIFLVARKRDFPAGPRPSAKEFLQVLLKGLLPLSLPFVLLGGIYSGIFTPTEAAAVAALYALFLAAIVYRKLNLRDFLDLLLVSVRSSASVSILIAGAFILNYVVVIEKVPNNIADAIAAANLTKVQFLIAINVVFLILGCLIDTTTMLLVLVPVLLPTVTQLGIDPVHFGVVVIVNTMIGLLTPPFGMILFIINGLTGTPLGGIIREIVPFLIMLIVVLLLISFVPILVLWLPQLFGYQV